MTHVLDEAVRGHKVVGDLRRAGPRGRPRVSERVADQVRHSPVRCHPVGDHRRAYRCRSPAAW